MHVVPGCRQGLPCLYSPCVSTYPSSPPTSEAFQLLQTPFPKGKEDRQILIDFVAGRSYSTAPPNQAPPPRPGT